MRQQLAVLRRSARKRLKVTAAGRVFWVWLRRVWGDWKSVLMIVKADTVVAWHRKGFRLFWTWKIHRGKRGRPSVPQEIRNLIRMLSRNNRAGVRHAFTANCSNWELRSKSPLDPNVLGIRFAEVESICRQMRDRANEYLTRNMTVLNQDQNAKLKVLEEALKLAPVISQAQYGNLIGGFTTAPYAFNEQFSGDRRLSNRRDHRSCEWMLLAVSGCSPKGSGANSGFTLNLHQSRCSHRGVFACDGDSASRLSARRHWVSDIAVGGSLGFLIGRLTYKRNHDNSLPGSPVSRAERRLIPEVGMNGSSVVLSWRLNGNQ